MDLETLRVGMDDYGVMTLTLNRPDRLNAFTTRMGRELIDVFDRADRDDAVRVVVVTGAGRGFCAGADLASGGSTFDARDAEGRQTAVARDEGGLVSLRIFDSKKPVIAAINGPAVGVGITHTLPMDIRLASQQSKFGFVFARRGIAPEAASGWFLPRIVGISQAMEWVATGRVFGPEEALEGGLVSEVLAPEALLPRAYELAREIAENTSPVSVALSRQIMWKMLGADHPMEAHRIDSRAVAYMGSSADGREGVMSFLEKRPPKFELSVDQDMPDFYPFWEPRRFD
ncbi:MAG: crotonase/enoyl-CoA hydratase family protein [Myxococcota bacterium]|nr:crotonase/enoyl-CoA hydratase family protein [Myxococcota bacterium]